MPLQETYSLLDMHLSPANVAVGGRNAKANDRDEIPGDHAYASFHDRSPQDTAARVRALPFWLAVGQAGRGLSSWSLVGVLLF
jgi:hypothetical protein